MVTMSGFPEHMQSKFPSFQVTQINVAEEEATVVHDGSLSEKILSSLEINVTGAVEMASVQTFGSPVFSTTSKADSFESLTRLQTQRGTASRQEVLKPGDTVVISGSKHHSGRGPCMR